LQQFGHLLESFRVNEILKQVSWLDEPINVGHYRTKDGAEVDLVLEVHGEGAASSKVDRFLRP
jgi:predicted AAA+ superfamily ATPase